MGNIAKSKKMSTFAASNRTLVGDFSHFINLRHPTYQNNKSINMKKIFTFLAFTSILTLGAHAQLGILSKAAQKVTDRVTEKISDKLADKASTAIFNRFGLDKNGDYQAVTFPQLFTNMPAVPTGQQLVDFQTALLSGRTLKMMTSPVTTFRTRAYSLLYRSETYSTQGMDSAALADYILKSTGMTIEEAESLEKMSEEEQQAFIMQKYQSREAMQARAEYARMATQYVQETEAQVMQYQMIEESIEALYHDMYTQIKPIYDKYREKMEASSDSKITLEYYSKIVNIHRATVDQAISIRLKQQLPLVEEIEKIHDGIRAEHPDAALVSYKQLFTSSYINEVENLMTIPIPQDN